MMFDFADLPEDKALVIESATVRQQFESTDKDDCPIEMYFLSTLPAGLGDPS